MPTMRVVLLQESVIILSPLILSFPLPPNLMNRDFSPYMDWVSVVTCKIDFIFKVKWQTDFALGGQLCILGFIIDILNKFNYIS